MSQAAVLPTSVAGRELCLHCGSEVPRRERTAFCCRGCETVYGLLRERGLSSSYYALRERAGGGRALGPSPDVGKFSYLDDPAFLADYSLDQGDPGREMRFYLEGAHCAACVWLTEKLPDFEAGVESLTLNLASGVALVRLRPGESFARAAEEITKLGYRPHPVKQREADEFREKDNRRHLVQLGVAGMASGNIMLLAVALYAGADGALARTFRWTSFALYLPVLLYSAIPFHRSAWASLRKRQISIDVPIVLGLLVGTGASVVNLILASEHIYFDSLSALVFLLLSTRYLLRKVNQGALGATELAHFLAPSKARRLPGNEEVPVDALKAGDLVQILPGECFPIDGVVTTGTSSVNCALLTGESEPVVVTPGDRISAGTWNQQAPVEVRVAASGAATRLGRILAAMEHGLASKAPIVTYLDRVGQAFVFAVLALTCVGFVLGLAVSWHEAINRALAVAIVVCPCTFALATPLAMSLAIARCARAGTLVKGADVLERLSQVKEVFFDKTGTLTVGELEVTEWKELEAGAGSALLALESRSAHPISKAVHRYFEARNGQESLPEVEDFQERAGVGLFGRVGGARYDVQGAGDGRIAVRRDGVLVGTFALSDQVRADSRAALQAIRGLGLNVHILSGDAPSPVQSVASQLGVSQENALPSVSPERKAEIVKATSGSLMVGDGANDAVALASAHASVAVRGGMEVSLRAAGAYSSRAGVMPVYSLLVAAGETMRVIRRNLGFAVLYNVVGVTLALSGKLDPLFAALLMPASALTVFLSTLAGTRRLRAEVGR